MQGHLDKKRSDGGLGLRHALVALFMMGYAIGSPDVAPMLPPHMERAFAKLHRELADAGVKTLDSASLTTSNSA